jgi:hypothetical protein
MGAGFQVRCATAHLQTRKYRAPEIIMAHWNLAAAGGPRSCRFRRRRIGIKSLTAKGKRLGHEQPLPGMITPGLWFCAHQTMTAARTVRASWWTTPTRVDSQDKVEADVTPGLERLTSSDGHQQFRMKSLPFHAA